MSCAVITARPSPSPIASLALSPRSTRGSNIFSLFSPFPPPLLFLSTRIDTDGPRVSTVPRKSMPIEGEKKGSDNASINSRKTFEYSFHPPSFLSYSIPSFHFLSFLSILCSLSLSLSRGRRAKNSSLNIYHDIYYRIWRERIFHRCDDEKITWEIPSVFIIVLSGIVPPRWRRTGEEIWWLKGGEDLELGETRAK